MSLYVCCFVCRVLLTRYLAETGESSSLAGVIAISAMWDGVESMRGLECFPNRQLYSRPLSHDIRKRVRTSVTSVSYRYQIKLCFSYRNMPKMLNKFSSLPYDFEEILQVASH